MVSFWLAVCFMGRALALICAREGCWRTCLCTSASIPSQLCGSNDTGIDVLGHAPARWRDHRNQDVLTGRFQCGLACQFLSFLVLGIILAGNLTASTRWTHRPSNLTPRASPACRRRFRPWSASSLARASPTEDLRHKLELADRCGRADAGGAGGGRPTVCGEDRPRARHGGLKAPSRV